jgi:hypothetical protein
MERTSSPPRQAGGVSVWHPQSLDIDTLLESLGQRIGEGVLWLGHSVFTGLVEDARCRDTGQVPLRAEYLRAVIGRHHLNTVREAAKKIGYVDHGCSYRAGVRSLPYWVLPPFDRAELVRREITDFGLAHNIRAWLEDRRRAMWQRIKSNKTLVDRQVCEHLQRQLHRIQINAEIDFSREFHPTYQIAVERIRGRDFWFVIDDYGRIHSNLTNLSRRLRQYLSVDGKPLVNVDISESQPLFMGMVIARQAVGGRNGKQKEKGSTGALHHMLVNSMMDTHPLLDGTFDRGRLPGDLRRYLELCEGRALYQTVADRLGKSRDEAKKAILVVFFDRPWHHNAVSAILGQLFPNVMHTMKEIKRLDYCRLAHFAQRIESGFMFGRVVPRIMAERPEMFVGTIHDSVLTTAGNGEFVRQLILDEFAKLGLRPQVKMEPCSGCC